MIFSKVPKLTTACLSSLVFALIPALSFALTLGDIRLRSHLNEPLEAEITLKSAKDIEISEIISSIPAKEDFQKAGLDPLNWLQSIRFEIIHNTKGQPVIKLKTKDPIKEPFVELLIEVTWPGGKVIREYTLLLDPPKVSVAPSLPQPVHTAQVSRKVASVVKPQPQLTPQNYPVGKNLHRGESYGPIYEETLWSIAKRLVENTPFTVYQGVAAISLKNPQAFKQGNINYMLEGSILALPNELELRAMAPYDAQRYVEEQNKNWRKRGTHFVENTDRTNTELTFSSVQTQNKKKQACNQKST